MRSVVAVTVMHVLLFVLHVCVLGGCKVARVTCSCGQCVYELYTWFRCFVIYR